MCETIIILFFCILVCVDGVNGEISINPNNQCRSKLSWTKQHKRAGPSKTKHCGKPSHSLTKKITFSYSDPGATLQNKLNDLIPVPLYSRKKSFVFQKKLKKMLLHWRANLADQNKQQPQEISISITYHT